VRASCVWPALSREGSRSLEIQSLMSMPLGSVLSSSQCLRWA